ncbi:exosortase F system-associated membrane protein [Ulvibacter antarcticus]|uniref:Exosortase F-associated protein n=1 Tax=Ulvibacter antarcticus TaxID=442714 RepID=A0A3L9Z3C9_9FLAO|nr:exosortase F system-associated protein [Ulvibacter antarcticus]RMA66507.1 exosortase F-associated protein [Ulvibacter antarcticus]
MSKLLKIAAVLVLLFLLMGIRGYEDQLFYDPLLTFFKSIQEKPILPEMDLVMLFLNVSLRFAMNTIISLAILWIIFQNKDIVRLSVILYLVLIIVLLPVFFVLVNASEGGQHMTLFYVRRFLIQPIFLLILIPAFYFQKKK